MANRERGEVELIVQGKPYTLRMSTNAIATVETRLKKRFGDILEDASNLSFTAIRDLVWPFLQKYHRDEFKTVESAGDFIDDAGGVAVVMLAITELAQLNMPRQSGGEGNPPAAQGGTGDVSTATPDESVSPLSNSGN